MRNASGDPSNKTVNKARARNGSRTREDFEENRVDFEENMCGKKQGMRVIIIIIRGARRTSYMVHGTRVNVGGKLPILKNNYQYYY